MKICPRCGKEKSLLDFIDASPGKGDSNGKYPYCNPCRNSYATDYNIKNREKICHNNRFRRYGLTRQQYEDMLILQNNCCGICHKVFLSTPSVDHNHKTGHVRGLVCQRCNTAIGFYELGFLSKIQEWVERK